MIENPMMQTLNNSDSLASTGALSSHAISVSELNFFMRDFLTHHFPMILVTGEISNLSTPRSGHRYFTLKDNSAQIRCAWFKHKQVGTNALYDGLEVTVKASVSLYPQRGDYQLIIDEILPVGDGKLQQQFSLLKQKLSEAGLFDACHKKPLPLFVKTLGIITSKTGAALQDCISVINRRAPMTSIIVYHSEVQGDAAPHNLQKAIKQANQEALCDVLLLTRGGGSMEDLWAFNDEALAYTLFDSSIPVVSAIGHEIDFTITDFVADKRAPTPSAAAELITIDQNTLLDTLQSLKQRFYRAIKHQIALKQQDLTLLVSTLPNPQNRLIQKAQHLDNIEHRLQAAILKQLQQKRQQVNIFTEQLNIQTLSLRLQQAKSRCLHLRSRLKGHIKQQLENKQLLFEARLARLNSVNPLTVMARGYSIVTDHDNKLVTNAKTLKIGQHINVRLDKGMVRGTVDRVMVED